MEIVKDRSKGVKLHVAINYVVFPMKLRSRQNDC